MRRLAGDFAHVRWSAHETTDPYSDVVVYECAHLLHYLKPSHYALPVRRGQERFIDTEFRHRELFAYSCEAYSRVVLHGERKSRIAFAEKMQQEACTNSSSAQTSAKRRMYLRLRGDKPFIGKLALQICRQVVDDLCAPAFPLLPIEDVAANLPI